VIEGRLLTDEEIDGPEPVALVSKAARDRYWGAESPLGSRVAIRDPRGESGRLVWHTIVGVVGDARHFGLDLEAPPALFASYRSFGGAGQLVVRTTADAQTMSAFLQETVARIAPLQAVGNFQTMQTIRSAALATPRLTATLMSLFAVLAMLITVVGIGGVVAFSVGQRAHEIGIRMALGAERRTVLGMVLRQGLSMVFVGLLLGTIGALWFGSLVAAFLFETEATDPSTFVGVALAVLAATVVACIVPARRATSIEPVAVLRAD
jgi:putative ABC transport system permease protein